MKILMVGNHQSVHGGITSVVTQLLNYGWNKKNIQLKYVPTYINANFILKSFFFFKACAKFYKELMYFKPDIVHIHMSHRGSFTRAYILSRMCKAKNVKVVIHLHGSEFDKWFYSLKNTQKARVRFFLRNVDRIIVLGDEWKNKIIRIEPLANITVIHNSVSIPSKMVKWNDKPFRILFLGVLVPRKGVADLLNALSLLKAKGKLENIQVIIAGNGKQEYELSNRTNELGLKETVKFVGWVNKSDREKLLLSSQLLVLPSYHEGLPMSILEAISYGMPVIATDVGDVNSAVINNKNGFLIRPGDVLSLENYIYEISSNKGEYNKMSNYSRKLAEEKFSSEKFFELVLRSYRQCLNQ